jgi:hypothetical protein
MSFHSFLAWIRATRRSSTPLLVEEGVVISTRLRELGSVTKCNPNEKGPIQTQDEDDQDKKNSHKFGT